MFRTILRHHPYLVDRAVLVTAASAFVAILALIAGVGLVTAPHAAAANHASGGDRPASVAESLHGAEGTVDVFVRTAGTNALEATSQPRRRGMRPSAVESAAEASVMATEARVAAVESTARSVDASATELYTLSYANTGVALRVSAEAIPTLARTPGVERISPLVRWYADDAPGGIGTPDAPSTTREGQASIPASANSYPNATGTDAVAAWAQGHAGEGSVVAVIDTGVDYTHADFGGPGTQGAYQAAIGDADEPINSSWYDSDKILPGHDFAGSDYNAGDHSTPHPDDNPIDGSGHGTHVAGIVAGYGVVGSSGYTGGYGDAGALPSFDVQPGIAPGAQILPLKIFGDNGGATWLGPVALDWIAQQVTEGGQHVDIASMSIGADLTGLDETTRETAEGLMANSDVLVVIAAGNAGDFTDVGGAPGVVAPALTVAASTYDDTVADFSSRGVHGSFQDTVKPDVTAPGDSVFSADIGTGTDGTSKSGTSMATPAVSGVAALVRGAHPGWGGLRLKAQIMNTAVHDVTIGGQSAAPARVGTGRVDAAAAVDSAVWLRSEENDQLVTASFGVVEAAGPVTRTRTITLTNSDSSARSYDIDYLARDAMPGVDYTVTPNHVTVPAGGSASVDLTLAIPDPTALRKQRDSTMASQAGGLPRQYVADASGVLQLVPSDAATGPTLRLAVFAAPKPVSDMQVDGALQVPGSDAGWLQLDGTGVDQGSGSERFASLVAPLVLGAQEAATTGSQDSPEDRAADLRAVGASSTTPQLGDPSQGILSIGIAMQRPWADLAGWQQNLTVEIDTNHDGHADEHITVLQPREEIQGEYYGFSQDQIAAVTAPASSSDPQADALDTQPIDLLDATHDTNSFDTEVVVLPVQLAALGYTDTDQHATVRYRVTSGSTSLPSDGSWVTFDAYQPPVWFGQSGGAGTIENNGAVFADAPGAVPMRVAEWAHDGATVPPLLVLHLHNATGARWETVTPAVTSLTAQLTGVDRAADFRVGDELVASVPTAAIDCTDKSYAWQRGGSAIPGATGQHYTPGMDDADEDVSVQVTCGSGAGAYVLTSTAVPVRVAISLVLSVTHRKHEFGAHDRSVVSATVVRPPGLAGSAQLLDDGHVLASTPLHAGDPGAHWKLARKMPQGKHPLTVRFVPSQPGFPIATSSAVTVKVTKAKLKKLKVKATKKVRKKGYRPHHQVKVKVKASKKLTSGTVAKGKVKLRVKQHGSFTTVKKKSMKKFRQGGGKLKLKIAKRYVHGKKVKVKAVYKPKKAWRGNVKKKKQKIVLHRR